MSARVVMTSADHPGEDIAARARNVTAPQTRNPRVRAPRVRSGGRRLRYLRSGLSTRAWIRVDRSRRRILGHGIPRLRALGRRHV